MSDIDKLPVLGAATGVYPAQTLTQHGQGRGSKARILFHHPLPRPAANILDQSKVGIQVIAVGVQQHQRRNAYAHGDQCRMVDREQFRARGIGERGVRFQYRPRHLSPPRAESNGVRPGVGPGKQISGCTGRQ